MKFVRALISSLILAASLGPAQAKSEPCVPNAWEGTGYKATFKNLDSLGYAMYAVRKLNAPAPPPYSAGAPAPAPIPAPIPAPTPAKDDSPVGYTVLGEVDPDTAKKQIARSGLVSMDYIFWVKGAPGDRPLFAAVGRRTSETDVSGEIRITDFADLYGRAVLDGPSLRTSHIADINAVRLSLGGGTNFVGVSQLALRSYLVGSEFSGSVQPGGGVAVETPMGPDQFFRFKLTTGVEFNKGRKLPTVSPSAAAMAEILF